MWKDIYPYTGHLKLGLKLLNELVPKFCEPL